MFGGSVDARIGALGVLLSLPFAVFYEAAHRLGLETLRDFMGPLSVVFYTALIPIVFYYINETLFENRRIAVLQALALLLGTMIFPYAAIGMEHAVTLLLLISYGFLIFYHKKGGAKFLVFTAIALSGATLIKSYSILFAIPIALYLLLSHRLKKDRNAVALGIGALCAGIAFHFLWNFAIYGNFFSGRYDLAWEFQYESLIAGIYGFLFSSGKGIFFFNPVLLLALSGFAQFFKKERALFALTAGAILTFLLFQSPFKFWSDEIWGPRKLLMIIPLLLLPLGYMWQEFGKRHLFAKITVFGVLAASFFVQTLGALYRTGKYLFFLREIKMDALPLMQYAPALSQISVHWFFLKAYLYNLAGAGIPVFTYKIESWMRAFFPAGRDIVLLGGSATPKEIFYTPDVWYLSKQIPYMWVSAEYKILYLLIVILGIAISGRMLYERVR